MLNPRTRLLNIIEILTLYSDECNILSSDEILEKLSEFGHNITKRALADDIRTINDSSYDIIHVNSPKKGYYLARSFDRNSMNIVLRALYSSPIISEKEVEQIKEFSRNYICNPSWDLLIETTANLNIRSTPKAISNEQIYELECAIKDSKQVMLTLVRIEPGERFSSPEKQETVIVNPIRFGITNNTYALAFTSAVTPSKPEYIRLSRIISVKTLNSKQNNKFKSNLGKCTGYFDKSPSLASKAEEICLVLRMKNADAEYIDGVFELPFQYRKEEENGYCLAKVNTPVNNRLLGCLLRVKDKIEIIQPKELKKLF